MHAPLPMVRLSGNHGPINRRKAYLEKGQQWEWVGIRGGGGVD